MLCGICEDLFRRDWEPDDGRSDRSKPQGHQPSISSFNVSIGQECQICNVLQESPVIQAKLKDVSKDQSPLIYCIRSGGQLTADQNSVYFELEFTVGFPKKDKLNIPDPADAIIEVATVERK
jgi:hypothetical protein